MSLHIYNTLSKKKELFTPLEKNHVRMYVCGMTTYDYCHIGHARVLVCFDVISRYLQSKGYKVTYVRNITDIDDKIIARAKENNEHYTSLTARFIKAMHEDATALGVLPPSQEPRATAYIQEMLDLIQLLIDKGYAYTTPKNDVFFKVKQFAEYGKLSRKNLDELLQGVRKELVGDKQDPRDFALWKSAAADDVHWQSPFGRGRPGWHIECSAMSMCTLGEQFDIHGGGPDLVFPHHENEIAQTEAATGKHWVNFWMHAGAVRVGTDKMSKSLGNFFTIREVLAKYHPQVVRFFLISSHYRSGISYSEDNLQEAKAALDRIYTALQGSESIKAASAAELEHNSSYRAFIKAMDDDFNTREALRVMFELVKKINTTTGAEKNSAIAKLKKMGEILGILDLPPQQYLQAKPEAINDDDLSPAQIEELIDKRELAKKNQDYQLADKIREQLTSAGIIVEDKAGGTSWRRK